MGMAHEHFMQTAIELAIASGKKGNHTFGAVLVHADKIIATAENTEMTGTGYGHAEYNLVIESAQQFPEAVLRDCTLYTSCAPCQRCAFAILALGIRRIVFSVSYARLAELFPAYKTLPMHDIVARLALDDVALLGPVLEDEGMHAFEYWDGEYRPLAELLASARNDATS